MTKGFHSLPFDLSACGNSWGARETPKVRQFGPAARPEKLGSATSKKQKLSKQRREHQKFSPADRFLLHLVTMAGGPKLDNEKMSKTGPAKVRPDSRQRRGVHKWGGHVERCDVCGLLQGRNTENAKERDFRTSPGPITTKQLHTK